MAMTPFYTRFRDLAFQEMRAATVQGRSDIPDDEYGFLELYCDEPDCDCRRVVINVISQTGGPKVWATINYGWESPEFYVRWAGYAAAAQDMAGAVLDPLNPQTRYSSALLRLFEFVLEDEAYVDRLKRHYQMFKAAVRQEAGVKPVRRKRFRKSRM